MRELITIPVPKEIHHALKKGVAHPRRVSYTLLMPDQPAADKDTVTIRLSRALKRRLQRLAESRGESVTDIVISLIEKAVRGVELTAKDYAEIAKEVAAAEERINSRKKK